MFFVKFIIFINLYVKLPKHRQLILGRWSYFDYYVNYAKKNDMNYDLDNYNDDDNINNERVACIKIYLMQQFVRFLCKIL